MNNLNVPVVVFIAQVAIESKTVDGTPTSAIHHIQKEKEDSTHTRDRTQ